MNLFLLAQVAPAAASEPVKKLNATEKALQQFWLDFWSMDWKLIDASEWLFVAKYYGLRAMFVVVLMILAWTLSGWLSSGVRRGLTRVRFDETLTKFISKLVRWGVLLLTGLTCLSYFGVETTSFAALIGAAGLAIGLAFQGTLSNFAAGAMLLIFRPYKVSDTVNIAGHLGKVNEIALFTTEIDTFDGRRVIIPNSSIFGAVIENITYHRSRRVDIEVGTEYSADIDQTRQALERAVAVVPQGLKDPPPAAVLLGLGASSVNWSVRVWANREDFGDAKQALIRAIKMELDRSQIGIPFPQMDVHIQSANGSEQAA
ncbi:mechanosensitive ion channel family protein [Bythopirellula polymerisocia]|nr:mechanosensitive ion channel domain-containing protein [Bythopirellula polymerisocia]